MSQKYCEDCGDEVETRRTRCPNCGKLVCGWCYYHIHGVYSMVPSDRIGQPNKACSGLAPESPEPDPLGMDIDEPWTESP